MTKQEVEIKIEFLKGVRKEAGDTLIAEYATDARLDPVEVYSLFTRPAASIR